MRKNKYSYLYVLQGNYTGKWEDLAYYPKSDLMAWHNALADLRVYRANDCNPFRIISRREEVIH